MSKYAKREIRNRIFSILYTVFFVFISTYLWYGYRDNIIKGQNVSFSKIAYAEKLDFVEITNPIDVNSNNIGEDTYTFSITNKSLNTINYSVSFREDINKIGSDGCSKIIPNNYIKYRIKKNNEEYSEVRNLAIDGKIYLDSLDGLDTSTFSVQYWVDKDAYKDVNNGHFHSKIALINYNY